MPRRGFANIEHVKMLNVCNPVFCLFVKIIPETK